MKKQLILFLTSLLGMFTTACAANNDNKSTVSNIKEQKTKEIEMTTPDKTLIVFFSHTGENYAVDNITKGNTHIIADMIAEVTGATTFEIVPENDYPESYEECIDVAKKELQNNARPAIKNDIDINGYETIFIGYPNWWGEPPMCVFTFIEGHDWTGKTVIPFITHEGSGMGGTDKLIANACKGATTAVGKGLAIRGATAQNNRNAAQRSVENWLKTFK